MCGILFALVNDQQDLTGEGWNRYHDSISARGESSFMHRSTGYVARTLISCAGPDSLQELSRNIHARHTDTLPSQPLHLRFLSSVLALRGNHVGVQPLVEARKGGAEGNILCWNGQVCVQGFWYDLDLTIIRRHTDFRGCICEP
jgi:asparagine synthetase B (glutamine-hydrolysing)